MLKVYWPLAKNTTLGLLTETNKPPWGFVISSPFEGDGGGGLIETGDLFDREGLS